MITQHHHTLNRTSPIWRSRQTRQTRRWLLSIACAGAGLFVSPSIQAETSFPNALTLSPNPSLQAAAEEQIETTIERALTLTYKDVSLDAFLDNQVDFYTPGTESRYILIVSNKGSDDATGVAIESQLPAGVTLVGSASCEAKGSADCGPFLETAAQRNSVEMTYGFLPANSAGALKLEMPVKLGSNMANAVLNHTATVQDFSSNHRVTAADKTPDALKRKSKIVIAKALMEGENRYAPGGRADLKLTLKNEGPSDVASATFTYPLPKGVGLDGSWRCLNTERASCVEPAGGSAGETKADLRVNIAVGDSLDIVLPLAFADDSTAYHEVF